MLISCASNDVLASCFLQLRIKDKRIIFSCPLEQASKEGENDNIFRSKQSQRCDVKTGWPLRSFSMLLDASLRSHHSICRHPSIARSQ